MEFEVEKMDSFTVANNFLLRDKNITNKARGLLCFMISLPPDWDYSFNGLVSCLKEGEKAIRSQLNELKEAGYVDILKKRDLNGQFKYQYIVKQTPVFKEELELEPTPQKRHAVKRSSVNGTQINNKITNTNKQDKLDKEDKASCDETLSDNLLSNLNPITVQLVKRDFIEITELDLFKYDDLLIKLINQYDYRLLITVVGYVITKMKKTNVDSKFAYFKTSVLENLNKLSSEDDEELYSEEGCSKLLEELIKNDNELNLTAEFNFDDFKKLYDALEEQMKVRSKGVP